MAKFKEAEAKAQDFAKSEKKLHIFLDDTLRSKKKSEEKVCVIKDKLVDTLDIFFEQAKE